MGQTVGSGGSKGCCAVFNYPRLSWFLHGPGAHHTERTRGPAVGAQDLSVDTVLAGRRATAGKIYATPFHPRLLKVMTNSKNARNLSKCPQGPRSARWTRNVPMRAGGRRSYFRTANACSWWRDAR